MCDLAVVETRLLKAQIGAQHGPREG
jgi:hypothetical protein